MDELTKAGLVLAALKTNVSVGTGIDGAWYAVTVPPNASSRAWRGDTPIEALAAAAEALGLSPIPLVETGMVQIPTKWVETWCDGLQAIMESVDSLATSLLQKRYYSNDADDELHGVFNELSIIQYSVESTLKPSASVLSGPSSSTNLVPKEGS